MKSGDLVEAEWDDHAFVFNRYDGSGVAHMRTIGYFVREDEDVLVLALTLQDGKDPCDAQIIDKRMLTKRRKL